VPVFLDGAPAHIIAWDSDTEGYFAILLTSTNAQRWVAWPSIRVTARTEKSDEDGMTWWNGLSEAERARWMERAGNTGRAVDAWRAYLTEQAP